MEVNRKVDKLLASNDPQNTEYAGSYAQEYEGWSDEAIEDVFEGDPDNYWNID